MRVEMTEKWLPVVGHEGRYEVSDLGRVRSKRKVLAHQFCWKGYPRVHLSASGKRQTLKIHRLVLTAFVGACPKGMEACHNDGVRTNVSLSNLRWDTPSNNQKDKIFHGTCLSGDMIACAKLCGKDVIRIRESYLFGATQKDLADSYGVSQVTISKAIRRKTWRHV